MRQAVRRRIIKTESAVPDEMQCFAPETVAKMLDVSMSTVWLLLSRGDLKSFKAGRSRRITRKALEQYQAGR